MAASDGGYRFRDILLFGGGLMFFGSYLGEIFSGWAPLVMAAFTGGLIGILVGEWNDGGGDGGLAAGLGGLVYVVFINIGTPIRVLASLSMVSFVMFAFLGMISGAVAGFIHQRATGGKEESDSDEPDEHPTG